MNTTEELSLIIGQIVETKNGIINNLQKIIHDKNEEIKLLEEQLEEVAKDDE